MALRTISPGCGVLASLMLFLWNVFRFRGPPPRGPPPQRQVSDEEVYQRPSIVKQEDLNEFEKKVENTEGGWAASTGEVDYSEKLVFSDEEDDATSGTSG